jgi:hypothetical protein
VIAGAIVVIIGVILIVIVTRPKDRVIMLEEVIEGGRVISHEDGVIEHHGVYYTLGTHDLYKRRDLLQALMPEVIDSPCIVDMRFNSQIIIKKGPVNEAVWYGPDNFERRRR